MVPGPINTILFQIFLSIAHGFQSQFQKHIAFRDGFHGCFVGMLPPSGSHMGTVTAVMIGHSLQGIRDKVLQEGLRWLGASIYIGLWCFRTHLWLLQERNHSNMWG